MAASVARSARVSFAFEEVWLWAIVKPLAAPSLLFTSLVSALVAEPSDVQVRAAAVLEDSCGICHDGSEGMNLEGDPAALVGLLASNGRPLVVAGDPQRSYLLHKIQGGPDIDGDPMPLDEPPLSEEDQRAIRMWIASLPPQPASTASTPDEVPPAGDASDAEEVGAADPTDPIAPGAKVDAPAPAPARKGRPVFAGTHQHVLHTTTTLGQRSFEFRVHHRFGRWGRPFVDRTYFGLAGGAIMSLAVSYGIIDGLDVMARWTNERLGHELAVKYVPIRQEDGKPLSFGLYASGEILAALPETTANKYTGNVQAMVSRLWWDRWATQLTVGFSALTNHDPAPQLTQSDDAVVRVKDERGTLYLGLASTVLLGKRKRHGIDLEYLLPIPDGRDDFNVFYYAGGDADPEGNPYGTFSLGWSVKAGLHFFQVFASTTRSIHTNLAAPGGGTGNPFVPIGNFHVGFNLSRKWSL